MEVAVSTVVVTGAAGFIGSTLVRHLLEQTDFQITGVDALTDYYDVALKRRNLGAIESERFTFIESDLNRLNLREILAGASHVFHLAGQPGVRKSWGAEFSEYIQHNILATQSLLEAAKGSTALKSLVYASSSSVYGEAERFPCLETDRPLPRSPYGVSKLAAEHLCGLYAHTYGVPAVSLRFFTVYGPGQRPDMAFNRFIRAVLEDREVEVYGDGSQIREFTFVDDITEAAMRAAVAELKPGTVINLSGGSSVDVNEVLSTLGDITGKEVRRQYVAAMDGDVHRTGGDTTQARLLLDWQPRTGLRTGLEREYEWLAEGGGSPSADLPVAQA